MVAYISSWARQIIVSVVLAIILEMILSPNSKSTKYIKTVIGIYVLYTIIAPGLKLIGGKSLDIASIDYENYFVNSDIYQDMENNLIEIDNDNFEETYKLNLRQDIENKLRQKGFLVSDIKLEVNLEESSEKYGEIEKMEISLSKKAESKAENEKKEIQVDKIKIGEQDKEVSMVNITDDEAIQIKEFIGGEYGIDKNDILLK